MPIVKNFTDFNTPDVFLREAEPAATIRAGGIGVVGILVQATRGPVGVPTIVSNLSEFARVFGGYDKALPEGFMFAYNLFRQQGVSAVKVVRVTDGDETVATASATGTVFSLATPGTWGNGVVLTVAESTVTGYVDLNFKYGAAEVYTYKQVTFEDENDERYFVKVIDADPAGFVTVTTAGNTNPAPGTYAFTGGTNGTAVDDGDYVTALQAFEADEEVNIIVSARASATVNNALIAHAALTTIPPRMVIIAPEFGATIEDVKTMMASINNDQVIVTYPHLQIANPYNNKKEYHTPTAFYAGVLAGLSYEQSPSRQQVIGVIGTEKALTRGEVDVLSQHRVSPISLIAGQGFVIRNGYNTSSVPARANITRRRAANFFARAFETGAQQFVSRPHTVALRNEIKTAFGSLIENELALGRIGNVNGGKPYAVKCDDQNNPDSVVRANRMMVDVQISLLAPADFILITMDASEAKVVTLE